MANWEKLDKQFYDLMNSFTDIAWETWMDNRAAKKAMREMELKMKAAMIEHKVKVDSEKWSKIYSGEHGSSSYKSLTNKIIIRSEKPNFEGEYPLAA